MIDTLLRPKFLPLIDSAGAKLAQSGFTANKLTMIAFAFGTGGCFAIGMQLYPLGLLLILLNRFLDALAGSLARRNGATDFGTMLDTLCDYLVFAGFAFLFSLSAMETMMASTFLIFSFLAMGMAYLSHAWLLARKNMAEGPRGGLIENGEMIVFITLSCLLPGYYAAFAAVFALLCWVTAALRFKAAVKTSKA